MVPPVMEKMAFESTYTPPPKSARLPKIMPPFSANAASSYTYTPPPSSSALLPEITPPFIVNVPGISSQVS